MLELSWRGAHEIPLADGDSRKFSRDGDVARLNSCWIILTSGMVQLLDHFDFGMVQACKTPQESKKKHTVANLEVC